tara:strand:- start:1326 stop:1769 length:444 start_codon:yes stop_codon:yes gene_type:complete
MKKLLSIVVLGLLLTSQAKSEYLMISKMRGTHWSFFGFSGKNVSVDVEKIGDEFYPLFYEDRPIFIEDTRVSEYFRYNNDRTRFACRIPVRPDGRDYVTRLIHSIWSFFKDKGYYTIKDNGEYEKVRVDELIFDCIKFENNKMVEPK